MSCPRNKHIFRCNQNGPPARRSEPDWHLEGAYLNRCVTDEQRSRRPIFIATLWAAASWLFFRVARSLHIASDMLVARALKNSQLTCGGRHAISGTGHRQPLSAIRTYSRQALQHAKLPALFFASLLPACKAHARGRASGPTAIRYRISTERIQSGRRT